MKLRMLAGLSGAAYSFSPGEYPPEGTFSPGEIKRLIAAGVIVDEDASGPIETAADPKAGVEYGGKRLFGAAAAAVRRKLGLA